MTNKTDKTNALHRQFPEHFKTKTNANWKAIIEAIGEEDQFIADLAEAVRQQFFTKTANRPYLDRLGSNVKVDRPRFVGMDDPTFRRYIPILAYQPKQVKLIIDTLLDIFFFKESTTGFIESTAAEPFNLEDGWQLEYKVDGIKTERIEFNADDFSNISAATAEEVVSAINRQANDSFAIVFNNSVTKLKTVRLFTNTIGSKGSVEITGGRANIELQFDGFITDAGQGNDTEWTVTKVGDTVTFEFVGGSSPGIQFLDTGDIAVIDLAGNIGSFVIESVDIAGNKFTFTNLFATEGNFTQTSDRQVKFLRPFNSVVYTRNRRAVTWETKPGQFTVEMPTSPPVVRRSLQGSAHINGENSLVINRVSDTELELTDASTWPESGQFFLQVRNNIVTKIGTELNDYETESRLCGFDQKYTYTGKSGNNLTGISPALPSLAAENEFTVNTAIRNSSNIATIATAEVHNLKVGDTAILQGLTTGVTSISNSVSLATPGSGGAQSGYYGGIVPFNPTFFGQTVDISAFTWVKVNNPFPSVGLNSGIFGHGRNIGTYKWLMQAQTEGDVNTCNLRIFLSSNGTSNPSATKIYTATNVNLNDGQWHHVGFTFSANTLRLYVDGVESTGGDIIQVSDSLINNLNNSTQQLNFNNLGIPSFERPLDGNTDETTYWDKELTPAEVAELYNGGFVYDYLTHSANSNLVEWWRHDDSSGSVFPGSINGQNGSLVGLGTFDISDAAPVDISQIPSTINGSHEVIEVIDDNTFRIFTFGQPENSINGSVRVERIGMANSGSLAILNTAQNAADTGIIGPYIWDEEAAFVLSSKTGGIGEEIKAGQIKKTLSLGANNIPSETGEVIFDFGTENQEGPIRYLFKPSDNTIAMDPAYIFQKDHELGSAITMINRRGPHNLSTNGSEYAPYITDTAIAREILQELILEAKSVGIFVEFLVRYPEQLYATVDVYRSGVDPG